MIELNLLPEERKVVAKKTVDWSQFPFIPAGVGVLILLVCVHVGAFILRIANRKTCAELKRKWETYTPKKRELDALMKEIEMRNLNVKSIEELTENRILWARLLNGLSDSMLSNIWLSSVSYADRGGQYMLLLEGFVTGDSEEGTAAVGKFINALKDNSEFFSNFNDVELESTRTSVIEGQEVMKFSLFCPFTKVRK